MFQFRRFPTYAYLIQRTLPEYCSGGFPHSEIPGSMDICSSPRLIAACHVLHRLLMPRHSPCALYSLTIEWSLIDQFSSWIMQAIFKSFLWLKLFLPFTFRCCSTIKHATFQTFIWKTSLLPCFTLKFFFLCSVFKVQSLTQGQK